MFKRAYLYACTAPIPNTQNTRGDEYEEPLHIHTQQIQKTYKRCSTAVTNAYTESQDEGKLEESQQTDETLVYWIPGRKVAKCKICSDKTMLNEETVQKHIHSKAHKAKLKRSEARKQEAEMSRQRFLQRMESVEKKAVDANRQ